MADREKVYGFELCANGEPCIGEKFMKCPFSPRNNAEQNCGVTMAKTAIALLQEQEAVEPYITGNGESFETAETWWYECGNCNKPIDPNDKFCRHCGRAVKW